MTATPARPHPTGRLAQLLDAMGADGDRWTTNKALRFYRGHVRSLAGASHGKVRAIARGDLRDLAAWGWLTAHDVASHSEYSLNTSTTGEPS